MYMLAVVIPPLPCSHYHTPRMGIVACFTGCRSCTPCWAADFWSALRLCCSITHTVVLDDPLEDPAGLQPPDRSPPLTDAILNVSAAQDSQQSPRLSAVDFCQNLCACPFGTCHMRACVWGVLVGVCVLFQPAMAWRWHASPPVGSDRRRWGPGGVGRPHGRGARGADRGARGPRARHHPGDGGRPAGRRLCAARERAVRLSTEPGHHRRRPADHLLTVRQGGEVRRHQRHRSGAGSVLYCRTRILADTLTRALLGL